MIVDLGTANSFLKYESSSSTITTSITMSDLSDYVGSHKIKLSLTDSKGVKKDESFDIVVICFA